MSTRIVRLSRILIAGITVAALVSALPAHAADPPLSFVGRFNAADARASAYFSFPVAVSGNTMIAGAGWDGAVAPSAGAVYVFTRNAAGVWSQTAKLRASDEATGDVFGASLAIDGDTIVVGAYGADPMGSSSGAAYVFTRSATGVWTQQAKLVATDGAVDDMFGDSVDVQGDVAVVGATYSDGLVADAGAAYVFTRSGGVWTQRAKLKASDGAAQDYFGQSLSISGGTVLVGAWGADEKADRAGAAYVFTGSGASWTQQAKLLAPDGAAIDQLGMGVSIDGDTAVASAPQSDAAGADSGCAYVWVRTGTSWSAPTRIVPADAAAGDGIGAFNYGIALKGDILVLGAYEDDDAAADAGSGYVFQRSMGTWSQIYKALASDAASLDHLGAMVAVSDDLVVLSADLAEVGAISSAGAAYVYSLHVPTTITIGTNVTSARIGQAPYISGKVTPSGLVGKNVMVMVKRPGKTYWSYSSWRTAYSWYGEPRWMYKYYFKPGMVKGVYYYYALVYPWPGYQYSRTPNTIAIRLR